MIHEALIVADEIVHSANKLGLKDEVSIEVTGNVLSFKVMAGDDMQVTRGVEVTLPVNKEFKPAIAATLAGDAYRDSAQKTLDEFLNQLPQFKAS